MRTARTPLREALVAIFLLSGTVVLDMASPSAMLGLLGCVGMAGLLLFLVGEIRLRELLGAGQGLLSLEIGLVAGATAMFVARLMRLVEDLEVPSASAAHIHTVRVYDGTFLGLSIAAIALHRRLRLSARVLEKLGKRPHLLLSFSFAGMIVVSTLLLCLPWSIAEPSQMRIVDELFTATSAVCVTGLSVHDVGTHYTAFGEFVLLLAIQFGGIGIMTLGALAVALARDSSLVTQAKYAEVFETGTLMELRGLTRTIVTTTFAIEFAGFVLMWMAWADDPRLEGRSVAWCAAFHSVSAFCNAGFSTLPRGMMDYTGNYSLQFVLMGLIVLGGLGFPVYQAMFTRVRERAVAWQRREPSLVRPYDYGSRVVLKATAFLIVGGTLALGLLEYHRAFAGMGFMDGAMAALFSSVTTRTAGFNTIDFGAMAPPGLLVTMLLMWIGGSPSSTAGGIKTTAASVLFANFVGEMRQHAPRLSGRVVAAESIRRASAVATLSIASVGLVVFALTLTETHDILKLAFEAVSALGTVGLSTGITPTLSDAGRVILVLAMFIGRTGPMTAALAVGARGQREKFRLPENDLQVW